MASAKKQKMEGEGKGEEDERPTICFVTGNANKLREVKAIFGDDFPFRMVNRKTRTQHAKHTQQHTHHSHALPTTPLLPRFFRATTQRDRTRSYLTRSLARSLLCRFARSLTFVTRSLVTYYTVLLSSGPPATTPWHTEKIDLPELQGEPEEVSTEKCKLAAAHAQCAVMTEDTSLVRQQRGRGWARVGVGTRICTSGRDCLRVCCLSASLPLYLSASLLLAG